MGLLDYLFQRTPRAIDPAPDFDVTIGNLRLNKDTLAPDVYARIQWQIATHGHVDLTITLPDEDDPSAIPSAASSGAKPAQSESVEPVFCTIDYVDVQGNRSRRRITTRSVQCHGPRSIIAAICHERNALRHFRLDRIERVVTFDGEIFAPNRFVADILGVHIANQAESLPKQSRPRSGPRPATPVNFDKHTRHAVIVLIAAAMADGHVHLAEVETILKYLEDEAFALQREGVIEAVPQVEAFDIIARQINRLRPTRDDLAAALKALKPYPPNQINRLKATIAKVIAADGVVYLSEEMFIDDLDRFLAQTEVSAWAELNLLVATN